MLYSLLKLPHRIPSHKIEVSGSDTCLVLQSAAFHLNSSVMGFFCVCVVGIWNWKVYPARLDWFHAPNLIFWSNKRRSSLFFVLRRRVDVCTSPYDMKRSELWLRVYSQWLNPPLCRLQCFVSICKAVSLIL